MSFVAAFAAGALLHFLLKRSWVRLYGQEAPVNPSQPGVGWGEALLWGSVTGAAAGIAKVLARRGTDLAKARLHR